MRANSIAAVLVGALVMSVQAFAEPQPELWKQIRKLDPGTPIAITVNRSAPVLRYFVGATDAELIALNLTNESVPQSARNRLRNVATNNAQYLMQSRSGGTVTDGDFVVGPGGIFIGKSKVADVRDVVEFIARDDIVSVTHPDGTPLVIVIDRPAEFSVGATGVLSWISSGGDIKATVSLPVSAYNTLELFAGPYRGTKIDDSSFGVVKAVYGFSIRRRLDRSTRPGVETFLSFGGVGTISRGKEFCRFVNCPTVTKAYPPLGGLVGGGVQYALSPRFAIRVEGEGLVAFFLPVGGRVSVSAVVPFGRYRATLK